MEKNVKFLNQGRFYSNILSIDIGTKNFAYCQFDPISKKILAWGRKDMSLDKKEHFIPAVVKFVNKFRQDEPKIFEESSSVVIEKQVRGSMRIIEAIVYSMFHEKAHIIDPKRVKTFYKKNLPVEKYEKKLTTSARYRKGKANAVMLASQFLSESLEKGFFLLLPRVSFVHTLYTKNMKVLMLKREERS